MMVQSLASINFKKSQKMKQPRKYKGRKHAAKVKNRFTWLRKIKKKLGFKKY